MRIAVIGTGHVGLVTCATLAHIGHDVVGTDADEGKIASLQSGVLPFHEPGLDALVDEGMGNGRLRFTQEAADAIRGARIAFISVGTPQRASGEANLVAVESAGQAVARYATGPCVVVEKSTVPTGTARKLRSTLIRERPDLADGLEVASNPEFLREGSAVQDALRPDRILVGAESAWAHDALREVYAPLIEQGCEYVASDIATAELAKHASNAFLALKISFANALARLCELSGADVVAVTDVMGKDPRIGHDFLGAGIGYGGSCFPKDLQALARVSGQLGYEFPLLTETARINDEAIDAALAKVKDALWNLEGKTVALLGLAFKPDTDDIRFSPALELARRLIAEGAHVVGFDPKAMDNARAEVAQLRVKDDVYSTLEGAHAAVLCTGWDEFRNLDPIRAAGLMTYPIIVDGRNFFDATKFLAAGFTYYSMGRSVIEGAQRQAFTKTGA